MKKLIYLFLILFGFICYGQPAFKVDSITLGTNLINQNNILVTNNFFNKIEIEKGLETEVTAQTKYISGTNNISISNEYYQVFSLTGPTEFTIDEKNSSSELGQFKIYLYASTNSFTFNTNYFDDSTITNLSISTNGVTILSIVKPPYASKWFVDQYKQYNEQIETLSIKENMVAYWAFNDNGIDSSGNGNNLTFSGGYTFTNGPINGEKAIDLNGINGYAYALDSVSLSITSDITISIWINEDTHKESALTPIFGKGGQDNGYSIDYSFFTQNYYNPDDYSFWINGYGAGNFVNGSWYGYAFTGSWTMFTCVYSYNNSIYKLYQNAIELTRNNNPTLYPIRNTSSSFYIGLQNGEYFDGKIAGVAIWNKTLSQEEIDLLYNNGNGLSLK